MKLAASPPVSPTPHAFTLIEVTLSVAIVAVGLVALLGLFPAGLRTEQEAVDATTVTHILGTLEQRLKGEPLVEGPASFSPVYFDHEGRLVPEDGDASTKARRIYRAEVIVRPWAAVPVNTSSLRPVKIELYWPINRVTGEPLGERFPKIEATTAVAADTGPNWPRIDRDYVPAIGF